MLNKLVIALATLIFIPSLSSYAEDTNLYPFKSIALKKFGYIDNYGRVSINPDFDYAEPFKKGISIYRKGNLFGFINSEGSVVEAKFHAIKGSTENMILAKQNDKWGYTDKKGEWIIKPIFDDAYYFQEDLAKVFINKKYGYINKSGKLVIPNKFDYAESFSNGFAQASFEYRDTTFINKEGKIVLKTENDYIYKFSEELAPMLINSLYGYVNKNGKKIIEPQFNQAGYFVNGIAPVKKLGKWGFINKEGKYIIRPDFEELRDFSQGISAFKVNNKWGFVDNTGKIIIIPEYEDAGLFSENLAPVKKEGHWGYINNKGEITINFVFDKAESFKGSLARVNENSYIDKTGEYIWSPSVYDEKVEPNINSIYNLQKGTNICVNHWGKGLGFCGSIYAIKKDSYIINLKSINCGTTRCLGGCSDKIIQDILKAPKNSYFMANDLYLIEVPKDCISLESKN